MQDLGALVSRSAPVWAAPVLSVPAEAELAEESLPLAHLAQMASGLQRQHRHAAVVAVVVAAAAVALYVAMVRPR